MVRIFSGYVINNGIFVGTGMVDWLIKNARIIDGMGNPSFTGDIAIQEDLIFDVGDLGNIGARNVIEASGKIAAPGFIAMHSHSDGLYLRDALLFAGPEDRFEAG